uniref:dynamin GTPase n=1 Tax=Steinernema glaseri TaxID=37863 RepID=A0A1I8AGX2_9BILA
MIRQEIDRLEDPSLEAAERVASHVNAVYRDAVEQMERYTDLKNYTLGKTEEFVASLASHVNAVYGDAVEQMERYTDLKNYTLGKTEEFVASCEKEAKLRIAREFKYERTNVWTEHIDLDISNAKRSLPESVKLGGVTFTWAMLSIDQNNGPVDDLKVENTKNTTRFALEGAVLRLYKLSDEEKVFLLPKGVTNPQEAIQFRDCSASKSNRWLDAFHGVGFYPFDSRTGEDASGSYEEFVRLDQLKSTDIQAVKSIVERFMAVEAKTIQTIVPKIITHTIVDQQKEYLECDLLCELQEMGEHLVRESAEAATKRSELTKKVDLCTEIVKQTEQMGLLSQL